MVHHPIQKILMEQKLVLIDNKSTIELGTTNKIELSGANSIATYLKNGISATNKGTITLTGDKLQSFMEKGEEDT